VEFFFVGVELGTWAWGLRSFTLGTQRFELPTTYPLDSRHMLSNRSGMCDDVFMFVLTILLCLLFVHNRGIRGHLHDSLLDYISFVFVPAYSSYAS